MTESDPSRYQEYGAPCPGLSWSADSDGSNVVDEALVYGEGEDSAGSLTEWPGSLIQ